MIKTLYMRISPHMLLGLAIMALVVLGALAGGVYYWRSTLGQDSSGHGFIGVSSKAELEAVPEDAEAVFIRDPALTDADLQKFLRKHTRLRTLRVTGSNHISAAGLSEVGLCWELAVLDLSNTTVADDLTVPLATLNSLKALDLSETQVTTLSDAVFSSNRQLHFLDAGGCKVSQAMIETCARSGLRELWLNGCSFMPGADVRALAKSRTLQILELGKTPVRIGEAELLCTIPTLKRLSLLYAPEISSAEGEQLRSRHPHIEILLGR